MLRAPSGATSSRQLLQDDRFTELYLLVRRPLEGSAPQAQDRAPLNFDQPDQWPELPEADVLFSSLGTTLRDAGSQTAQYRVDYGYQCSGAPRRCQGHPFRPRLLLGRSPGSNFYSRMKGELEGAGVRRCPSAASAFSAPHQLLCVLAPPAAASASQRPSFGG